MTEFDVSLAHWPTLRVLGEDESDAIAEYKRLYGLDTSNNPFIAVKAEAGSAAPVEPKAWSDLRKQYGTLGTERKAVAPSPKTKPAGG